MRQDRTFTGVIRNQNFFTLWMAQIASQTAQNGIHFVQIVLIETLTRSTAHMAIMILSFSLPAVLLSSVAGIAVDRLSNKLVMLASNGIRVLTVTTYILVLDRLGGWSLLLVIYAVTFISSAIGQFFAPAEATTIPLLVGEERLLTANALFNLTLIGTQVVGLVIVAPLTVKLLGIKGAFGIVALMYLTASVLVSRIPRDKPKLIVEAGASMLKRVWEELRAGWRYVASRRPIQIALAQLTMTTTLLLMMAMIAPGYATRVLGMLPEDAIFVFAPAGVGMLANTFLIGRFGYKFRREVMSSVGFSAMVLTLFGFGLAGFDLPLWLTLPKVPAVMLLSLTLGAEIALVAIPSETLLQEKSPPELRGRVIAVYFLLANMVAIPIMLLVGTVADQVGIARVVMGVVAFLLIIAATTTYQAFRVREVGGGIFDTGTAIEYYSHASDE
ncbi:MAG: MFS transporter [Anaerolineae bacterium]|nr:MFS transporter [Anaerolineae bacterium]NIN96627.1 MFS transporter [Anaerolineae bacterium]NIQ79660.1 MFS transporter [Anaerolineae bacterium]